MKYKSTRDSSVRFSFEEVVFKGLADEGGLFVPESIPKISRETLDSWTSLSFPELAAEVMTLFIEDEITKEELLELTKKSYSTFTHKDVVPIVSLSTKLSFFEIFHGPTYAFKDVALQFLGNLFEFFLQRRKREKGEEKRITVLGATSGDTGSAAIFGLRGKDLIDVFILFPKGRVAPIQEKQMTTVLDDNVHNIKLNGYFDDCQNIVKAGFADTEFKTKYNLAAVNSINWARILAQIVYYVYCYLCWEKKNEKKGEELHISVPSGNFGNALAGFFAQRMGVPISNIGIATNANDILFRYLSTGDLSKKPVIGTIAPAMDISISSNFERYLYYLCGENSDTLKGWMENFKNTGKVEIPDDLYQQSKQQFFTGRADDDEIRGIIKQWYDSNQYILCPHSACGVKLGQENLKDNVHMICMGTAHPAKFGEAVLAAISRKPDLPPGLACLDGKQTRVIESENCLMQIKKIVSEKSQCKV